jgi:hypothetical protein
MRATKLCSSNVVELECVYVLFISAIGTALLEPVLNHKLSIFLS